MKKKNFFIIIALVAFSFSSCKTLQVDAPKESYLPTTLAPANSEFPIQAEIDVKQLETTLNKKLTGLLYEGKNINNQDLSIKVWKAQNFAFTVKNNVIEYQVPLKIWTRFAWNIEKFGFTIGDHYEATGSIALSFKTTISIDKNWKLVAKTTPTGYQWIETPKLNVVGVTVPVTPIANFALDKSTTFITDQIDQTLAQMVELKKYVQMAWSEIQKPIQVSPETNLWLRITPKEMSVAPFTTVGQKLSIGMSMNAQIESFMGVQPKANAPVALAPLKSVPAISKNFNLNVAADVTFDKITELTRQQLVNKTFAEGKKSITITDVSIYGSAGKVIFVADVVGSVKGRIYFTGNLIYNAEKTAIEVENPQFELKTQNGLLKSAEWLLHGVILNKLKPYLSYPVKSDIESMKTEANTFKSDYGNFSDGFRKAFHHETISYNRRKDREFVELEKPRISALLSGTPRQIQSLIPDAENGLFSRFIFYFMNVRPVWNDVFANSSDQTLDSYFNHLGMQFFDLYKHLEYQSEPIRFCLTSGQQQAFNAYFAQTQNQYLCLYGADYLATVRRLGLITFRMAMILTALRIMDDGDIHSPLVCRDNDFNTALSMVKILVLHAAQVFQQLPSEAVTTAPKNQKQQFLDELPKEFCRKDYLTVANKLGIPDKTAEKHIKRFAINGLINHFAHDKYKKL